MRKEASFGLVETRGYIGALTAADAMAKAAHVSLLRTHKAGSARMVVICEGDVAACAAAVDAGADAAQRVGELLSHNVMARPEQDGATLLVDVLLDSMQQRKRERKKTRVAAFAAAPATPASTPAAPVVPVVPAAHAASAESPLSTEQDAPVTSASAAPAASTDGPDSSAAQYGQGATAQTAPSRKAGRPSKAEFNTGKKK